VNRRILFAGGASGGHIYPGLALAEDLAHRGEVEALFLSGGDALAESILAPRGIRTLPDPVSAGGAPWRWGLAGRRLARCLDREGIDAVVALGGRPGLLPGAWARWNRRPLFLLEQNRVLGRANRLLLPLSTRIFLSFEDTEPEAPLRHRALRLGCPVRREFSPADAQAGEPLLLVLGGSQGALDLNEIAAAAIAATRVRPLKVIHICGPGKEKGIEERYRAAGVLASVQGFLQDPSGALRQATLVLARAGGSTIAELTAVGRGSLLLPYPHHRDRHQFRNADALVAAGAAELIEGDSASLVARLDALLDEPGRCAAMARAARSLGRPDAAARIADVIATHLDCDPSRRRDARGRDCSPRPFAAAAPGGPIGGSEGRG
jgi:UDP-N-acetylglucosamine--N-acetylmuramyl-(pentapeptide) pyrophosphoryl-undecaprenol N-acetylglucosamine transferase